MPLPTGKPPVLMAYDATLRDYFAIHAFQALLAKYTDWSLDELTDQAYLDADALLKAREVTL